MNKKYIYLSVLQVWEKGWRDVEFCRETDKDGKKRFSEVIEDYVRQGWIVKVAKRRIVNHGQQLCLQNIH